MIPALSGHPFEKNEIPQIQFQVTVWAGWLHKSGDSGASLLYNGSKWLSVVHLCLHQRWACGEKPLLSQTGLNEICLICISSRFDKACNQHWLGIHSARTKLCLLYPQWRKKNHISKNKCWWGVRESDYVCLRQIGGNESRDCTCSHTLKQRSLGN